MARRRVRQMPRILALVALLAACGISVSAPHALADTQNPSAVTLAGNFEHLIGCAGDYDPACAAAHMTKGVGNVWTATYTFATGGTFKYKAAINDSYNESYGGPTHLGDDYPIVIPDGAKVTFVYDQVTHYLNDSINSTLVTAAGSFQNEIGCASDWKPSCTASLMEDTTATGVYTYTTPVGLKDSDPYNGNPPTHFEWKAVLNLDDNFGTAYPDGNSTFDIPGPKSYATLSFDSHAKTVSVKQASTTPTHDNNVEYDGLKHDSRDTLYRTPGGAVNPGTTVTLRFRTFHNDVTGVVARFYDSSVGKEERDPMTLAAYDADCYDAALTAAGDTCDFWQVTYTPKALATVYYRFIVTDGTTSAYYADTANRYDGLGIATKDEQDNGFRLNVVDPNFQIVPWMQNGVMYQIFPDRFRNGDKTNDAKTTEPRYAYPAPANATADQKQAAADAQIIVKKWNELPEGYCSGYVAPAAKCTESPKGRDYFGGDLQGVDQKLGYLQSLGITIIYFNPIFEAGSNHGYDTRDYLKIDHRFGNSQVFKKLVKDADAKGIHIVLDGVFNHMSSDSPFFDRYHHYSTLGACESPKSPYRSWFVFVKPDGSHPGVCAGDDGTPNALGYVGWAGYDSIPQIQKSDPADPTKPYGPVADYFYAKGTKSVAGYWLSQGTSGWRFDVMTDPSFPSAYWQQLRQVTKTINPSEVLIAEAWHWYDNLPLTHGDQADTAMGYRFRNAALGLVGAVDDKGFNEENNPNLGPSTFANRLLSMREDYADATYYTFQNLMDSHDTARVLWSVTPPNDPKNVHSNREDKEFNAANLAVGKAREAVIAAVQMTVPGTPTIYYGDEVSLTGDSDPDDRRPFPWNLDSKGNYVEVKGDPYFGAAGDHSTLDLYKKLISIRKDNSVLREGKLTFLLADDTNKTLAYAMRKGDALAIIVINRNETTPQVIKVPTAPYLRDGVTLSDALGYIGFSSANTTGRTPNGIGGSVTTSGGSFSVALNPLDVAIYVMKSGQDITGPAPATALTAVTTNGLSSSVALTWTGNSDSASYNVYRSPVSGGGYVKIANVTTTTYTDSSVVNGHNYYYVVRGVDKAGNEGDNSTEASAIPAFPIGFAVLQYPKTVTQPISVTPITVYGQVNIPGLTDKGGDPGAIIAQLGYGKHGDDLSKWTWTAMTFNAGHTGDSNYEYVGTFRPETPGDYDYLVRFSDDTGKTFVYGDQNGVGTATPGRLTLQPSSNTSVPTAPVASIDYSAAALIVSWTASTDAVGPADVVEYHIFRGTTAGGEDLSHPVAVVSGSTLTYTDTGVSPGATYFYVVKAYNTALTASPASNEVTATVKPKLVQVTFKVKVPSWTPKGDTVYVSGTVPGYTPDPLCGYCGGGTTATALHETAPGSHIWTITLGMPDGTTGVQYKYTRGSYLTVEEWGSITGFTNRQFTVQANSPTDLTQTVDDTSDTNSDDNHKAVQNWRDAIVTGTTPAASSTGAAPAAIKVTFNWDVTSSGGDFSNAIVVTKGGTAVAGTVSHDATSMSLTFTPSAAFTSGTYSVTVDHVVSATQQNDGQPIQTPYTFTFTVS